MRILVLRGGALGDLIVTLPALALLRQRWPGARLELAGNPVAGQLAREAGLVDAVHSQHEGRWAALHGPPPLAAEFHDWLASFDLVVSYWPDPDGDLARHFPLRPTQRFLAWPALPSRGPAAAFYCEPLAALGLQPAALTVRLRPTPVHRARIALHPGSGSARKNWPLDRWTELARWLRHDRNHDLLIISGEAEAPDLLADFGPSLRCRPLPELLDQLAACRLFIGHDSGIAHLATAAGTPSLLLFGPTDPAIWAPPAPTVRVIRHGAELDRISLAAVQAQADAMLAG